MILHTIFPVANPALQGKLEEESCCFQNDKQFQEDQFFY
jgi:hypothetical protein